jgi:hypothetical protein
MLDQESKKEKKYEYIKNTAYAENMYFEESDLKNPKNPAVLQYHLIYHAALTSDEKQLKNTFCINVHKGLQTPVQQLAEEGKTDAVNLLIGKFYGDMNEAVFGAEKGGEKNRVLAENLLERGASLDFAVRGAAISGDIARVEALLLRGANPSAALQGEGIGGFIWNETKKFKRILSSIFYDFTAFLEDSLKLESTPHCQLVKKLLEKKAKMKYFYLGAGQGNHHDLLKYLNKNQFYLDRHSSRFIGHVVYKDKCEKYAMMGAVEAGNIELYNNLRSTCHMTNNEFRCEFAPDLIFAAARSGDFNLADFFPTRRYSYYSADQNGLLCGGFFELYEKIEKKRRKFYLNKLGNQCGFDHSYIKNIFESGQFQIVNLLSEKILNIEISCNLSKNPYFANDQIALQSLSRIHNEILRNKIARAAKKTKLLPTAKAVEKMMKEHHFSFEKSLHVITHSDQLNQEEIKEVIQDTTFEKQKLDLCQGLQAEFLASGVFFPDYRFSKLRIQCDEATSEESMRDVLESAKQSVKKNDRYSQFISEHLCYFNKSLEEKSIYRPAI